MPEIKMVEQYEILTQNKVRNSEGEIKTVYALEISLKNGGKRFYRPGDPFFNACCPTGIGMKSDGYELDAEKVMLT